MGSPNGIVANMLDCDVIVNEFKLQSHYCVLFWTNALLKDTYSFIKTNTTNHWTKTIENIKFLINSIQRPHNIKNKITPKNLLNKTILINKTIHITRINQNPLRDPMMMKVWILNLITQLQSSIYIYIYIYKHIHIYTYIYTHIHTYTHTYIYTHAFIHTHTYIYIHTHIYTHTYTYTHIHIHIHTHTYVHTHTHTYVYIYIYKFRWI